MINESLLSLDSTAHAHAAQRWMPCSGCTDSLAIRTLHSSSSPARVRTPQAVQRQADDALRKVSVCGVQAAARTLSTDGYAEFARRFAIEAFPSVVALGRGGGTTAVSGEITEAKLLRAFVLASAPWSFCGAGCKPSGCGQ